MFISGFQVRICAQSLMVTFISSTSVFLIINLKKKLLLAVINVTQWWNERSHKYLLCLRRFMTLILVWEIFWKETKLCKTKICLKFS
jgi:hypothetical protein